MADFNSLNALEKLDSFLNAAIICQKEHGIVRINELADVIGVVKYDYALFESIGGQLALDGYIYETKNGNGKYWAFYISFKGDVFSQKGGYIQQNLNDKVRLYLRQLQTFLIGLAAVVATIYYLHELLLSKETASSIIHYHIF